MKIRNSSTRKKAVPLILTVLLLLTYSASVSAAGAVSNSSGIPASALDYTATTVASGLHLPASVLNYTATTVASRPGLPAPSLNYTATASLSASTALASDEIVAKVIKDISRSVVGIIGRLKTSSADYEEGGENIVFGSGIIYKPNGYILTNSHVVADMESIAVVLSNGKTYNAKLKYHDEMTDLAIIKIDVGMLVPAKFGSIKDIIVGKPIIAIGTPISFSLRNSATMGIISGVNRPVDGDYRFIQIDAAINGGNSGGPLVDLKGNVIGINTAKFYGIGIEGLSFSIPVDTVKYVIGQYEKYGKIKRPYLGTVLAESVAAKYGMPTREGLVVMSVEKGSPAEKAGILADDIIMKVNNVLVTTRVDYNEEMKKYMPGTIVEMQIIRNGKLIKLKVKYGEKK